MCLPNSYVLFLLFIVLVCHGYGEYVFRYLKAVKLKFLQLYRTFVFQY